MADVDTATLAAPPMPTWHGYGTGLEDKYIAFVTQQMTVRAQAEPEQLTVKIRREEAELADSKAFLKRLNQQREEQMETIAQIVQLINGELSDAQIVEELARMSAMGCVIGTRTDMQGRLFVQIRVTVAKDGIFRDVGDYEICFGGGEEYAADSYTIHLIRVPRGIDPYYHIPAWSGNRDYGGAWTGYMTVPGYHLISGRLVDFVTQIYNQLATSVWDDEKQTGYSFPELDNPEQVWDGFTLNPLKAYKRSITLFKVEQPKRALHRYESELHDTESRITQYIRVVRERQAALRVMRATHAEAIQAAVKGISINTRQLRKDIEYIARLPGVMGITFDDDGVPIIHIRTTHARDGRRYDLGDLELSLTAAERNSTVSVVKVRCTRLSHQSMYLHHPFTHDTWFCFGDRAEELRRLLVRGDYTHFVHLAINCLNAINDGSDNHDDLSRYYNEIPIDAVWKKKRKPMRLRRRTRPLEEVLSESQVS